MIQIQKAPPSFESAFNCLFLPD